MNIATILDRALRTANIPIDGVSIGDPNLRLTWSVAFQPAATPAQRTSAQTIINTIVVDTAAQTLEDQRSAQLCVDNWPIETRALVLALIDQLNTIRAALPSPLGAITPAQALAAIRAKAGTL